MNAKRAKRCASLADAVPKQEPIDCHRPDSRYAATNRERRRHKISVTTLFLVVRCGRVVGRRAGYRNALAERHSGGRASRPPSFVMKLQAAAWRAASTAPVSSSSRCADSIGQCSLWRGGGNTRRWGCALPLSRRRAFSEPTRAASGSGGERQSRRACCLGDQSLGFRGGCRTNQSEIMCVNAPGDNTCENVAKRPKTGTALSFAPEFHLFLPPLVGRSNLPGLRNSLRAEEGAYGQRPDARGVVRAGRLSARVDARRLSP